MKRLIFSILLLLLIQTVDCQTIKYPTTLRVDSSDTYFGVKVNDPYRWLENDSSADTESWIGAENRVTNDYIALIPFREQIKKELTANYNYPKLSAPRKYGDYYYFTKNTGLQNQDIIYRMKNPADTGNAEAFSRSQCFCQQWVCHFRGI